MIYVLRLETINGVADETQVVRLGASVFPCGHCSRDEIAVYHNTLGKHLHIRDESEYEEIRKVASWENTCRSASL